MKIDNLIKTKALPSFCTANMDVLKSIMFFCNLKKLPCLIECTSNQVNQDGGYTKKHGDHVIVIPVFNKKLVTPISEALQPLIWHYLISTPELQKIKTKW